MFLWPIYVQVGAMSCAEMLCRRRPTLLELLSTRLLRRDLQYLAHFEIKG